MDKLHAKLEVNQSYRLTYNAKLTILEHMVEGQIFLKKIAQITGFDNLYPLLSCQGLKLSLDCTPQDSPCHLVPGQRVKK